MMRVLTPNGNVIEVEKAEAIVEKRVSFNGRDIRLCQTAKDKSQASITFSVGIQNDATVNGYSITNIAETPGLGMKAQEEAFYSQFEGKNVDSFTVVKAAPSSDSEIESISGATITSKAMTRRRFLNLYVLIRDLV